MNPTGTEQVWPDCKTGRTRQTGVFLRQLRDRAFLFLAYPMNVEDVATKIEFGLCKAHNDFIHSKGPVWENRIKLFLLETAVQSQEFKKLLPYGLDERAIRKGQVNKALETLSPICCRYWDRAFDYAKKQREIFVMNMKREARDSAALKESKGPQEETSLWCPTHFVLVMTMPTAAVEEISAQMVQQALTMPKVQAELARGYEDAPAKMYNAENLTRTLDKFKPLCCHIGDEKLGELVEINAPKKS